MTTINTTKTLETMLEELNAIRINGTGTEISTLVDTINQACKAQTEQNISDRIAEILGMEADRVAMFTEFINNPMAETVRLKQDQKSGEYSITNGEKQVSFMSLEKAYQVKCGTVKADGTVDADTSKTLAQSKRYYAMLTYFTDNLTRAIAGDLSEQAKKVSVPVMTSGTEDERKEFDFSGVSTNAMEAQINAIVSTILPAEMTVQMKRVDVKALKQAATTEKFMKFTMSNEGRMLNKILAAVRIRMNDEAYVLTSKAKAHKKPQTANEGDSLKQEAAMSKVTERRR